MDATSSPLIWGTESSSLCWADLEEADEAENNSGFLENTVSTETNSFTAPSSACAAPSSARVALLPEPEFTVVRSRSHLRNNRHSCHKYAGEKRPRVQSVAHPPFYANNAQFPHPVRQNNRHYNSGPCRNADDSARRMQPRRRNAPVREVSAPAASLLWEVPCSLQYFSVAPENLADISTESRRFLDEQKDMISRVAPWPDVWRKAIEANWVLGRINQACAFKPFSRAFFKMAELFCHFGNLVETPASGSICSAHIGEAPGGFFQATVRHLGFLLETDVYRRILNGHHNLFCSHVVSLPNDIWPDDLQPITSVQNLHSFDIVQDPAARDAFVRKVGPSCHLVTADGGFEVQVEKRREQEMIMYPLLVAELEIAMALLLPGGNLVLKLFAIDTDESRKLLLRVFQSFHTASLVIPTASKPTNDERYVVAKGFIAAASPVSEIPAEWITWFNMYCMEDKVLQSGPLSVAISMCRTMTTETRIPLEPSLGRAKEYCTRLGLPVKSVAQA